MKRVLHILTGMARGGCEGNALCLVTHAQDCRHTVLVLGERGEMSAEFAAVCAEVRYLSPLSKVPWLLSRQICRSLKDLKPDGVIVWHGMVMLPQILHALRDFQIPVLVHGGNPAYSMPARVDWRYLVLETLLGQRAAATYVCCSRHVADSFLGSRYLRRFPAMVVPNGVRSPAQEQVHEPRALSAGMPVVLGMVARLDGIKDHATLLRAFALVLEQWPKAVLELAGDGGQRSALEAEAAQLDIPGKVRFLGMVPDVYEVMERWDAFAYATTAQEGLGNALAEAMMQGLPCVATDVGPVREVVGEPPVAELVAAADPQALAAGLLGLLEGMERRIHLGRAARRRALLEFSPEIYARRYLKLMFP